ncbi:hypothetical protein D3C86_1576920 [compost metagenome]
MNLNLSTSPHQKIDEGSEEFFEYLALTLKGFRVVREGLCDVELVRPKVGIEPHSGNASDRYFRWFHFRWKLTEQGEQALANARAAQGKRLLFDMSTYRVDIPLTVSTIEEHLEDDKINAEILNFVFHTNDAPEFDKLRQKYILEKLARTQQDKFLVRAA